MKGSGLPFVVDDRFRLARLTLELIPYVSEDLCP